MNGVDADTGNFFDKIDTWLDGFFTLLPNILLALFVIGIFVGLSILIGRFIRSAADKRDRESLGQVAGSLARWSLVILGVMFAITIISPSVTPADLLAGFGVSSVAIGFAFKDILQNMLAGILILLRQPFQVGDEIVSSGHTGRVEKIETRAKMIKTYDGRRVVIPNAQIYTDSVVVITAFEKIRSEYDIGVGCNDDWQNARDIMIKAAKECEGVLSDPAPEAIPVAIADFSNNIRLRWWTRSDRGSVIHTRGEVIQAVYRALDEAGIDMPYPTSMVLFHDQTEEVDGDRARQREGWPAPAEGRAPKPARQTSSKQSEHAREEQAA